MYDAVSAFTIGINTAIFLLYLIIRRKIPAQPIPLNHPQDKKQFWEQLLQNHDASQPSLPNIQYPTPRNDYLLQQFWFIEKFFLLHTLLNYSHLFYCLRKLNCEFRQFSCRYPSQFWQSLILTMMLYQLAAAVLPLSALFPCLLAIGALNILQQHYLRPKDLMEESMGYYSRKISLLRELFPGTIMEQPLDRYAFTLQQQEEPTWLFGLFAAAYLIGFQIRPTEWVGAFGFMYGGLLEQTARIGFSFAYGRWKAKNWLLQGPDTVYLEMQNLADYFKPQLQLQFQKNSPQKYIINDTHNISGLSKDQSNILIQQSTNDLLQHRHKGLRITSANLGTIEDTKLDIADLQCNPQPMDSEKPLDSDAQNMGKMILKTDQQETQAEDAIFKKKKAHHRIKLDALYHSKNTQRSHYPPPPQFYSSKKSHSPTQSVQRSPGSEFNPIQILHNLSPISQNPSSQRQQFPNTFEEVNAIMDQNETIKQSEFAETIEQAGPLQIIHNNRSSFQNSVNSGKGRRNNSQKTSKEEEEASYIQQRKIKVNSVTKQRRKSPEQKRRRSTNSKVRGESVKVKRRDDIPVLNFDSERFKSPYLEFLPGLMEPQRTQRKQNASANKKMLRQIIQNCENSQTSNENRGKDE